MVITRNNQGTINADPGHWTRPSSAVSSNIVAKLDLTAQDTDIASMLLYTTSVNGGGLYRVTSYVTVTQAADTDSTAPALMIEWTDPDSSAALSAAMGGDITSNVAGDFSGATSVMNVKAGTEINLSASGYLSTGLTPMRYAVHVCLEQIG